MAPKAALFSINFQVKVPLLGTNRKYSIRLHILKKDEVKISQISAARLRGHADLRAERGFSSDPKPDRDFSFGELEIALLTRQPSEERLCFRFSSNSTVISTARRKLVAEN